MTDESLRTVQSNTSDQHSWMTEEGSSGGEYTFCVRCGAYGDEPAAKEPCPGNPLPDEEKKRIEAKWPI